MLPRVASKSREFAASSLRNKDSQTSAIEAPPVALEAYCDDTQGRTGGERGAGGDGRQREAEDPAAHDARVRDIGSDVWFE